MVQYILLADRGEGLIIFADEKAFPRNIQAEFFCDFRLDIRDSGKKCEIKGNKEKSRESGGSGQGKQPWGVGRYVLTLMTMFLDCPALSVTDGTVLYSTEP